HSLICRCCGAHHFSNSPHTLNCHLERSEGVAFQSAAVEFKYLALIPAVAFSSESSDRTIGNCTLRCASASSTFSVGILPTSSSFANVHPPRPPIVPPPRAPLQSSTHRRKDSRKPSICRPPCRVQPHRLPL